MKLLTCYAIVLARLVILELAILFLLWWQAMANVIFTNTAKFRMSDPFTLGLKAASSVSFYVVPFVVIPLLASFAFPVISQRTSAGFLAVLFVPLFCIGAFVSSFSLIPLSTALVLAVLAIVVYRASHAAR